MGVKQAGMWTTEMRDGRREGVAEREARRAWRKRATWAAWASLSKFNQLISLWLSLPTSPSYPDSLFIRFQLKRHCTSASGHLLVDVRGSWGNSI
eukprot:1676284-Rhodomonas_salina.1